MAKVNKNISGSDQKVNFYPELRLMEKAANQAMVRLEHLKIKSPAYTAIQGQLEILGKQTKGDRGRRFSETGKATYNEYQHLKKILDDFLHMKTRTQYGAKQWVSDIWESARKNEELKLEQSGITRDDWLDFWSNMPSKHKDRMFGSDITVQLLRTYTLKNKDLKDEQKMSMQEIADAIEQSKNVSAARKALGLTAEEYQSVVKFGWLPEEKHVTKRRKNKKRKTSNKRVRR